MSSWFSCGLVVKIEMLKSWLIWIKHEGKKLRASLV